MAFLDCSLYSLNAYLKTHVTPFFENQTTEYLQSKKKVVVDEWYLIPIEKFYIFSLQETNQFERMLN